MADNRKCPLIVIDVVCGCTVAACLVGSFWLITVRSDDASARVLQLQQAVNTTSQELAAFRGARDKQRSILARRKAELAVTGQLPELPPTEHYFQTLSDLAEQHDLKVRRHQPVTPRFYPGLLEQRYAYELSGSLPDLVRFFRSVEGSEFWADISYLKVEGGQGGRNINNGERIASLTISLFSALPAEEKADTG